MDARRLRSATREPWAEFATGFSRRMLASLPRSDQRLKGERYISGLLSVPGRKTMRSIAACGGGGAAEQSVHHFISKSSWDWLQVRQTLGRNLDRVVRPQAWVVHPMAIPKWGRHSVGVQESYVAQLGRVVNSQQAYGLWLANEDVSAPVNWRLVLPPGWLSDEQRRRRAEIPEDLAVASADQTIVNAVREVAEGWGLERRPVVLDGRQATDASAIADALCRLGIPFVMRINGSTPLVPGDLAAVGDRADRHVEAWRLMQRVRRAALPVRWLESESAQAADCVLVARTGVVLPWSTTTAGTGPRRRPLALVGTWRGAGGVPDELWLSNLLASRAGDLLRLGRLIGRVEADSGAVAERVGIKDFEGRCFGGWHRHLTLCSVAHAIVTLSSTSAGTAVDGGLLSA
ncbi:transposase [Streptomyces sp. NBC_00335]|uniref:IS701 family transposase n=1 Tax=unclassified Streptomyces TaxID=2593676 RepID=UPI0022545734|nr:MULTISPECIES: transposase [unclassified Streptomyces]MCX5406597.1 transposase [Streptomyces sp. NBC_00086]